MGVASTADKVSLAGKSQSCFFRRPLWQQKLFCSARQWWLLAPQHCLQGLQQHPPMVFAISAVEQPLLTWVGLFVSVVSPHLKVFFWSDRSINHMGSLRLYSITDRRLSNAQRVRRR